MMKELSLQQVSPFVRGANYSSLNPLKFGPRVNYGYQMFYVFSGNGTGRINANSFDLRPGVFAVYGPGDEHEFTSHGQDAMAFATIYFSWEDVGAARLATGNQNVARVTDDYWRLADPKVSIAELPSIPFMLELSTRQRLKIEAQLCDTGKSFRVSDDPLRQLKYKAALLEIIYNLMVFQRDASGHAEHQIVRRFREHIEKHYTEKINRTDVSHYLGTSESYLTALLRKELNTNFTACLTAVRMQKAIELLQYSRLSVKEIAAVVGFGDYNYFVARFRQLHGKPPGAFRQ